jgi:outer membrane protein assembly factor BamB
MMVPEYETTSRRLQFSQENSCASAGNVKNTERQRKAIRARGIPVIGQRLAWQNRRLRSNVPCSCGLVLTILFCISTSTPCRAQPSATYGLLHEASHQAGLGRWVDAIEIYQRVLETGGDDLVPADRPIAPLANLAGGSVWAIPWPSFHARSARWICHERISRFPAEGLKAYRSRVDAAAARRLDDGRKRSDDIVLEQLLAEWFCSRAGEDAIRLLGERAFDRADLDSAERWWSMLLPVTASNPFALRFPDPATPAAWVRARLLLIKLFRGEREGVWCELKAFRSAYSDASGLLAGKEGKYADTLESLLADPKQVTLAEDLASTKIWQTFAGRSDRNTLITSSLPRYWPGPPSWRTPIPSEVSGGRDGVPGAPDHPRALAFHSVVAGGRVFVADAARVFSFDLATGERTTLLDLRKRLPLTGIDLRLPARIDTRYTLSFADGFLYARLGSQPLKTTSTEADRSLSSAIACFGPIAPRGAEAIELRWLLQPSDAQSIFEGAPLVHGDRLYALIWRFGGGEPVRHVVCYRSLGRKEVPEIAWEREIGRVPRPTKNEDTVRHELLTLAENNVIYGSNGGSIVALDSRTGKPAWEYRYTASERRPPPAGRDLTPCLFDGFRIFAAPNDSDRVFCLDAFSGRLLWDREGVDVVHLLGVVHRRLIATFAGPMKGIRGLSVATGSGARPDGWTQHLEGGSTTFGRGLVTPDLIFWPTKQGLYFLNPEDGSPIRQPIEGSFGNLVYADGSFIVTTANEVVGYVSDSKLLEPRKETPEKKPAKIIIYRQKGSDIEVGRFPDLKILLKDEKQVEFSPATFRPLLPIHSRSKSAEHTDLIWLSQRDDIRTDPNRNGGQFLELRCTHQIDCGLIWDNNLVLAGANGATCFRLDDAEPIWSWRLADDAQLHLSRDSPDVLSGRLTGWHREGDHLYVLLNESRLLFLKTTTGKIAWQHRADEVGETIPQVSIRPKYFVSPRRLLIQLSTGQLRIVNTADGKAIGEFSSPRAPWITDPLPLSDQRVVFPEDAETVSCMDVETGRFVWRYPLERPASLTGSLPWLRVFGRILLIETERNLGVEIEAVDPVSAQRIWKEPVFVGARRFTLRDADSDGKRIYLPGESGIVAVTLATGERLWESPLPEAARGEWQIHCAQKQLLAHPVEAIRLGNADREWDRLRQGWPNVARVTRFAKKQYDADMNRTLPVVILDSADGRVLQRLSFPAHGPACSVRLRTDSMFAVSTGSGVWQLR